MRVICTPCSASQDPATTPLPAGRRYISARIDSVHEMAARRRIPCLLLSGGRGLVAWDEPIPHEDHHLTADEVPALVSLLARQLEERGIRRVEYYTQAVTDGYAPASHYLEATRMACDHTGVDLQVSTIKDTALGHDAWKHAIELAGEARYVMLADRVEGEARFSRLLARHPDEPLIYYERWLGYKALCEDGLARREAQSIRRLHRAQGHGPSPVRRPPQRREERPDTPTAYGDMAASLVVGEARLSIDNLRRVPEHLRAGARLAMDRLMIDPAGAASDLRRLTESLAFSLLDPSDDPPPEDLRAAIGILEARQIVPGVVADHMHIVRRSGNLAMHPRPGDPPLRPGDVVRSVRAFAVILKWLDIR
jgi:hypothetical protein